MDSIKRKCADSSFIYSDQYLFLVLVAVPCRFKDLIILSTYPDPLS